MISIAPTWSVLGLLGLCAYFLLPALLVVGSKRPSANPWQWVLATVLTGWVGFTIFLAATEARCNPAPPRR